MSMYQPRTKSGLLLDEASSTLQKCIRRRMLLEAVMCAQELSRSGFFSYTFGRLFVIACEDVGPANPSLAGTIYALHQTAVLLSKKKNPSGSELHQVGETQLVNAVALLALSPKSRLVPEVSFVAQRRHEKGEALVVPDFAKDWHTASGRALGRRKNTQVGVTHWITEGKALVDEVSFDDDRWKNAARAEWDEILASLDEDRRS